MRRKLIAVLERITAKIGFYDKARKLESDHYDITNIKGPNWIKSPSLEDHGYEADWEYYENCGNDPQKLFKDAKVVTLRGEAIKRIDLGCPGFFVPEGWLDPTENVGLEYDANGGRYSHIHHKDLIPAMVNGGDVYMPIIGPQFALGGRHRIVYAYHLGIPLKVLELPDRHRKYKYDKLSEEEYKEKVRTCQT